MSEYGENLRGAYGKQATIATSSVATSGSTTLVTGVAGKQVMVHWIQLQMNNGAAAIFVDLLDGGTNVMAFAWAALALGSEFVNLYPKPWLLGVGNDLVFSKSVTPTGLRITAGYDLV